jgi:agmatine deiminase
VEAVELTRPDLTPPPAPQKPIRLPAQWEPMETIILTWPTLYPPLWALHAEMVKAIAPVCGVTINVGRPTWASGVRLFLQQYGITDFANIRFLNLPTDDIWVRDYGPFVGLDEQGEQIAISATFDPLATYPQQQDNAMAMRWAAHNEIPAREVDLHIEGGNYWSDGVGTLIMSDETLIRHKQMGLNAQEVERRLHETFLFDKLIVTPHMLQEETGHVDMLVKLADAQTVLVTRADPSTKPNTENLLKTAEIFRKEANAMGDSYKVVELPALPRYFNWGVFSIWRSYTNSLTVNGRVLVPVYGEPSDDVALRIYEQAMPRHEIVPINSAVGINGGGAVHCMTKEVPQSRNKR